MDGFGKLPRDAQLVLIGALVYVVVSFLDWQQPRLPIFGQLTVGGGRSEWDGVGILAGLLGFALLAWELGRAFDANISLLALSKAATSLLLAMLLAFFTVITFLTHGTARHWPAWVGLGVALGIAVVAWGRGRREGVQIPTSSA